MAKDIRGLFWKHFFKYRRKIRTFFTNRYMKLIFRLKGIKYGKKVIFNGKAYFHRCPDSRIMIGNSCRFNSARYAITENLLYKPCSISTTRENAELVFGDNVGATSLNIMCANKITIGKNSMLGANCVIIDSDMHHSDPDKRSEYNIPSRPVTIGENVFLGFNCTVLKGVTIGDNSVIGANSVVMKNIPANAIAMGNPCKVVMVRKTSG